MIPRRFLTKRTSSTVSTKHLSLFSSSTLSKIQTVRGPLTHRLEYQTPLYFMFSRLSSHFNNVLRPARPIDTNCGSNTNLLYIFEVLLFLYIPVTLTILSVGIILLKYQIKLLHNGLYALLHKDVSSHCRHIYYSYNRL